MYNGRCEVTNWERLREEILRWDHAIERACIEGAPDEYESQSGRRSMIEDVLAEMARLEAEHPESVPAPPIPSREACEAAGRALREMSDIAQVCILDDRGMTAEEKDEVRFLGLVAVYLRALHGPGPRMNNNSAQTKGEVK